MAGLVPFLEISSFLGLNNTTDPSRIPVTRRGAFLVDGENVDIDDEKMLHRRKGFNQVFQGDIHSLWSNGDICLFVQGPELKRLWPDYTSTILLNGGNHVNGLKMQFVEGGGKIFFCNNSIIGYIELTRASKLVVARTFKPFTLYLGAAILYFVLCYGLSRFDAGYLRKKFSANLAGA